MQINPDFLPHDLFNTTFRLPGSTRLNSTFNSTIESGFTLIEVMVTLVLAGLLVSMAVPSFAEMVKNNRITTKTNEFITAMHIARSEAIKRSALIDVIATTGTSSNEWGGGWRVEVSGGDVLKNFEAFSGNGTLDSNGDKTTFQYQASGRVDSADTIFICDDRTGETGRQVTIATTGRVAVAPYTCS